MPWRIKLHTKILDWWWYSDINVRLVFLHLLLTVNRKEKKRRGITISPGQLICWVWSFAKNVGITVQQTRTAFYKLKSTNEITIKTTNSFSLITVVRRSDYQSQENKVTNDQQTKNDVFCDIPLKSTNEITNENTLKPQLKSTKTSVLTSWITNEITNEQQTDNKPVTTTIEYKNIDNNIYNAKKSLFKKSIVDCIHGVENYQLLFTASVLDSFYDYWTEPDKKWKMKYELQKTWDIKKRLFTWLENKVTNFWKNNVDFWKWKTEQLAKKKIDDNGMDAYDRVIAQSLTSPTPSHGLNWNNPTPTT